MLFFDGDESHGRIPKNLKLAGGFNLFEKY